MLFVPLPPAQAVQLKHCQKGEQDDKATLRVTIEPDGTVSDVSVETADADLRECVERTARRWRFARSRQPRTIVWPILFAKTG